MKTAEEVIDACDEIVDVIDGFRARLKTLKLGSAAYRRLTRREWERRKRLADTIKAANFTAAAYLGARSKVQNA